MASEFDNKSDRLFPPGDTLRDILFGGSVPLIESRSVIARHYRGRSLDIFVRWGLDANNDDATKEAKRLAGRCGSDDEHCRRILDVVDQVARAERAKLISKDADVRARYKDLANSGVRAAKLARDIARMMDGGRSEISRLGWLDKPELTKLVVRLVDFVDCCVSESSVGDSTLAIELARLMLCDLENGWGVVPGRLIARLVCLANGTPVGTALSESTIRRYGLKMVNAKWEPRTPPMTAAGRAWKENWPLVVEISQLGASISSLQEGLSVPR